MDDIDVPDAPHAPELLLLAMQTPPHEVAEDLALRDRLRAHTLRALRDLVLVNGPPVRVGVVLLRPPVVSVVVGERRGVDGRLSPGPRRSEIVQGRTHAADDRRALRARSGRLLVPFPLRLAFGQAQSATQGALKAEVGQGGLGAATRRVLHLPCFCNRSSLQVRVN